MPSTTIIDSHIHLWPQETANQDGFVWMTTDHPLASPHLLADYRRASDRDKANFKVEGVVYVETDVRYETPGGNVTQWAKGPLDEIFFIRNVSEGKYDDRDSGLLLGIVPWAPLDQAIEVLEHYLELAEERAGPEVWKRVKGFRYLLQAIPSQKAFEDLVFSETFVGNLKLLGRRGFSFDVGVDQHSGGSWQLEAIAATMELAHTGVSEDEKVVFIINHLCKPDFSAQDVKFQQWCNAISKMATFPKTFMKLSGAFSELPPGLKSADDVASHMKPWLTHIFRSFGPDRVMFGSDWPVCNVKGPKGKESFTAWRDVISLVLADKTYGLSEAQRRMVWHETALRAYRLS